MMVRSWAVWALALLPCTCLCASDSFYLELAPSGRRLGPFEYREGAEVRLGRAVFTVIPISNETAAASTPAASGGITGYDGIRFGDTIEDVLKRLLWLPGVRKNDSGAPIFQRVKGEPFYRYHVFRAPNESDNLSEVIVFFEEDGVSMIQDTFAGDWMLNTDDAMAEFERKKKQLTARFGNPTEAYSGYAEWLRADGLAALRLEDPEEPGDLPMLKLGLRRK